jgi:hypothetical protein
VDGKIVALVAGISVEAVIDGAMSGQIATPHRASTWGEIKARMPPKEFKRLVKKVRDGKTDQDKLPSDDNSPFNPGIGFRSGLMGTIQTGFSKDRLMAPEINNQTLCVSFGVALSAPSTNVRFWGNSGHHDLTASCPVLTRLGHQWPNLVRRARLSSHSLTC